MSIVANKFAGITAACVESVFAAKMCKAINDANVLTLGARVIGPELAKMIVSAWVKSEFDGGRSLPKVERMKQLERQEQIPSGA